MQTESILNVYLFTRLNVPHYHIALNEEIYLANFDRDGCRICQVATIQNQLLKHCSIFFLSKVNISEIV